MSQTTRANSTTTNPPSVFIDAYNDRCEPFTWTKTADHILTKAHRQRSQTRDTTRREDR